MDRSLLNEFESKFFNLEHDSIREWAKDNLDIGNVLRGLANNCFALLADFEQSNEICFVYIQYSFEKPDRADLQR